MKRFQIQRIVEYVVKSPILWGGLVAYVFYAFIQTGTIKSPLLVRYLASHPIEYVETIMFFIGMSALVLKGIDLFQQQKGVTAKPILPEIGEQRVDTRSCETYQSLVEKFIKLHGPSLYPSRMFKALKYVKQCESAEQLDSELRFLADEDAMNAEADYGFVQLIIWAIPILGFLGTVVGIAVAMGNLNPEELENSLPLVMSGLTVAFDTTAIALTFSIILFFSKYVISKQENRILREVDSAVDDELRGRFELIGIAADNKELISVRKMLESVVASIEQLIRTQSSIWEQAIDASNTRHANLAQESAAQLQTALSGAIQANIDQHARSLAASEEQLLQKTREIAQGFNHSMQQNIVQIKSLQDSLVQQSEVFQSILDATGHIAKLEDRLNQNLSALAGSRHFEETVNSLAAVIHLLNSKLSGYSSEPQIIQLPRNGAPDNKHAENTNRNDRKPSKKDKGYAA